MMVNDEKLCPPTHEAANGKEEEKEEKKEEGKSKTFLIFESFRRVDPNPLVLHARHFDAFESTTDQYHPVFKELLKTRHLVGLRCDL
jgi:hypothetical protein